MAFGFGSRITAPALLSAGGGGGGFDPSMLTITAGRLRSWWKNGTATMNTMSDGSGVSPGAGDPIGLIVSEALESTFDLAMETSSNKGTKTADGPYFDTIFEGLWNSGLPQYVVPGTTGLTVAFRFKSTNAAGGVTDYFLFGARDNVGGGPATKAANGICLSSDGKLYMGVDSGNGIAYDPGDVYDTFCTVVGVWNPAVSDKLKLYFNSDTPSATATTALSGYLERVIMQGSGGAGITISGWFFCAEAFGDADVANLRVWLEG